jgi:hypothetical protein
MAGRADFSVISSSLRVERRVEARQLFLQHDVAGALFAERQALVVGVLEGLEGAHHLAMRHHGVERNARLGLELIVGIDIHWFLLVNGCESARRRSVLHRVAITRRSERWFSTRPPPHAGRDMASLFASSQKAAGSGR